MENKIFDRQPNEDSENDKDDNVDNTHKPDKKDKAKKKQTDNFWIESKESSKYKEPSTTQESSSDVVKRAEIISSLLKKLDTSEDSSPDAPQDPENITEDEANQVSRQIIDSHKEDLKQELHQSDKDSAEIVGILSSALLLDSLAQKLDEGEPLSDSTLDDTLSEVVANIDEIEQPLEGSNPTIDAEGGGSEEASNSATTEHVDSAPIPRDTVPNFSVTLPPSPPAVPTTNILSRRGGGSEEGLLPPTGTYTEPISHISTSPANQAVEISGNRNQRGADLLVGGIVGYLIGRRRGRIKTEKRMLPVQKSLEKQVRDLNDKITHSEQKIRKLSSEKFILEGEATKQVIISKLNTKARKELGLNDTHRYINQSTEVNKESRDVATDERLQRSRTGKIASILIDKPEIVHSRDSLVVTTIATETVTSMSDAELLAVAAKVVVDGQSASQLHEQGRLSKDDLRKVVTEHVSRTGGAKRLLIELLKPKPRLEGIERLSVRTVTDKDIAVSSPTVPDMQSSDMDSVSITQGESSDSSIKDNESMVQQVTAGNMSEQPSILWLVLAIAVVIVVIIGLTV